MYFNRGLVVGGRGERLRLPSGNRRVARNHWRRYTSLGFDRESQRRDVEQEHAICFFALVATGERTSVQTRRLVFSGMVIVIVGLIFAAINLRKRPGWTGFGRGVAIGLALALMALGPCAACYILTLFG